MTKLDHALNTTSVLSLAIDVDRARAIVAQMYRERGEPVRADAVMAGHHAYHDAVDAVVYVLRSAK